ncbi:MAG: UDP-phosphate alpha-N-acetylglucosaminyltransferase [Rickettsiaceae bacterium]|nr:UDP-phosphate alpha-N-acetylglucosaminyltransferase [Rickettsiaceae bacterium]
MSYLAKICILFTLSLIASLIFTKVLIKLIPKFGIVDHPDIRRTHKKVTPRGGGITLLIVFTTFFPIFEYTTLSNFYYSPLIMQVFLPISLISLLDDIIEVAVSIRLITHLICSLLAVLWLIQPSTLFHDELPVYLDLAIATIGLTVFLNVYNFLDGIDGITATESTHLSLTIILLSILRSDIIPNIDFILITATILLAFSLAFLVFNWHPAKIFMGDVGSISFGFLFGICLLMIATASERLFVSAVIAALYYIADGGLTILMRLVKGEKIWQAHLNHFFQKAIKKGKTTYYVIFNILFCNFILMLLSVSALYYPIISMGLALLTVMITLIRLIL